MKFNGSISHKVWQTVTLAYVKSRMEAGYKINALNKDGITDLHSAAFYNSDPEVTKALINCGANVNAQGGSYNNTALHLAMFNNPISKVATALINGGADARLINNKG